LTALDMETRENEVVLTFEHFYTDRFNLIVDGDITEEMVQGIKITQLNQNGFYESKDVDVRLNKANLTAKSLCGQYSTNAPINAIDGDENTYFHSEVYSGSYGDFVIGLEKKYLVNRIQFRTRANNDGNGNGRVRAYEVLYKSFENDSWNKAFEQLVEESGESREAVFPAVLAKEICIRVTNGKNKYIVINELDIFKYNSIEEKIASLFSDSSETELKEGTTLEQIESLQKEIATESYSLRVENAKELYIQSLTQYIFPISLNGERIFDSIQFTTDERVLRASIKYVDSYGVERLAETNFEVLGKIYTLKIRKTMTNDASLVVYGVQNVQNIFTNSFNKSDFYLNEDVDTRISVDKMEVSATNVHASYPLINMFDGDLNTQYRASQYVDYEDIYLKLDKEYLIDR
ncbi:MAG: discoidin domain-containing protein, partial [Cetobacterium sp.]